MSQYDPPDPPSPQAQRRINFVATTVVLLGAAIGIWHLVWQYYPFWHWHEDLHSAPWVPGGHGSSHLNLK